MFDDPTDEWHDWYRLTPQERWAESQKLLAQYLSLGGSLDKKLDPQSPFNFLPELWADTNKPEVKLRLVRSSTLKVSERVGKVWTFLRE